MPPDANEALVHAYLAHLRENSNTTRYTTITSGGVARWVDFYNMSQTHSGTGKVRKIRMLAGVPSEWESPPESLLQQGDHLQSFYVEVLDRTIHTKVRVVL